MANIATAGNFNQLDQLPGLENYDAIIIHLDADVAGMNYLHCGPAIATLTTKMGWLLLPCQQRTLPATLQSLEKVIASWILPLNLTHPGNLLCLPAQAMESWLAAAVLPPTHHLLNNIEINSNLEAQLKLLPQNLKMKKDIKTYRQKAPMISKNWATVKQVCSQADVFDKGLPADIKNAPGFPGSVAYQITSKIKILCCRGLRAYDRFQSGDVYEYVLTVA